ncbi:Histone-lysine N-methyltransferase ASHR1 [Platanthera guangdongensis]|uniref:Histone-lysine N-methyltransferase ASHR1 n=1 Tax=Platanthera guangdongensis TaxID=2320717 RepID=A0ABR2MRH2_9ASPA
MEPLERALSAEGLTLSAIPGKGRGLIADKNFFPGPSPFLWDVVICQEPYASSPSKTSTELRCDGCFASAGLKKCSQCRIAWYCGSACQGKVYLHFTLVVGPFPRPLLSGDALCN